jgi:hypothetical protein
MCSYLGIEELGYQASQPQSINNAGGSQSGLFGRVRVTFAEVDAAGRIAHRLRNAVPNVTWPF